MHGERSVGALLVGVRDVHQGSTHHGRRERSHLALVLGWLSHLTVAIGELLGLWIPVLLVAVGRSSSGGGGGGGVVDRSGLLTGGIHFDVAGGHRRRSSKVELESMMTGGWLFLGHSHHGFVGDAEGGGGRRGKVIQCWLIAKLGHFDNRGKLEDVGRSLLLTVVVIKSTMAVVVIGGAVGGWLIRWVFHRFGWKTGLEGKGVVSAVGSTKGENGRHVVARREKRRVMCLRGK